MCDGDFDGFDGFDESSGGNHGDKHGDYDFSEEGFFGNIYHYDIHGNLTGESRPNLYGGYDDFDEKGNKIGESIDDIIGEGYDHYDNGMHYSGHSYSLYKESDIKGETSGDDGDGDFYEDGPGGGYGGYNPPKRSGFSNGNNTKADKYGYVPPEHLTSDEYEKREKFYREKIRNSVLIILALCVLPVIGIVAMVYSLLEYPTTSNNGVTVFIILFLLLIISFIIMLLNPKIFFDRLKKEREVYVSSLDPGDKKRFSEKNNRKSTKRIIITAAVISVIVLIAVIACVNMYNNSTAGKYNKAVQMVLNDDYSGANDILVKESLIYTGYKNSMGLHSFCEACMEHNSGDFIRAHYTLKYADEHGLKQVSDKKLKEKIEKKRRIIESDYNRMLISSEEAYNNAAETTAVETTAPETKPPETTAPQTAPETTVPSGGGNSSNITTPNTGSGGKKYNAAQLPSGNGKKSETTAKNKSNGKSGNHDPRVDDFTHPEDFYDWYYDDFIDYEDAEDYYYSHGGK